MRRYSRRRRGRRRGGYKRRQLKRVGFYPNSRATCKTASSVSLTDGDFDTGTDWKINTLHALHLTTIQHGVGADERERNVVNCRGFRIRFNVQNFYTENIEPGATPLYMNMALVSPRGYQITSATQNTYLNEAFFRSFGSSRVRNFDAPLAGLTRHTLPINTDKWAVIWHHRKVIGSQSGEEKFSSGAGGPRNWHSLSRYIKVGRQTRYVDGTTTSCQNQIWLLIWFSPFNQNSGSTDTVKAANAWLSVIQYFKDPKS